MVAGAISCLLERGYKIPQQISVVGFDDIPYARYIYPKLTTVRYPIEEMGGRAAELALSLRDHKPVGAGAQVRGRAGQTGIRCLSSRHWP